MQRRAFLMSTLGAGVFGARRAWPQAGSGDPLYQQLLTDRRRFGRVIHLYGDSIFHGWALGQFADDTPPTHPLHAFRAPASMANLILEENGVRTRFAYGGVAIGDPASPDLLRSRAEAGVIRAGDVVALEDAGDHNEDPGSYEKEWQALRAAVTDRQAVTAVLMSMFDYHPDPRYQYDAPFGGVTMNQAIRAAARARGGPGKCVWLDMNAAMDAWRSFAQASDGVAVMHEDGIHPNVWGQMLLSGELLKVAGLRPHIRTVGSVVTAARRNYPALAYGSATFTADRAESYTRRCLLS